ncbi:UvrD-helicase domain-containing protein [Leuconostoc gelidum subsp. gasicomitatum]|uniref:UvrD-helicase domain-containing protein n=1 Tax=Leuconostoc gasicomitatum TaxID=115778 RepID=UPI001CC78848|nr:UvrD-helicase domain-containing protein [Leuconostoc gasicomitatum]MBZ5984126.1 UvrD-helicase domain-containing protein [Leuconostoc gasicomitatum]
MVGKRIKKEFENVRIIDAPAGSGKTFGIRNQVLNYITEFPDKKVLTITFTNRAADELQRNISSEQVYISTIHSFINDLIKPFFKDRDVINYYITTKRSQIIEKIEDDEKNFKSNQSFRDKYEILDLETICANLYEKGIYYNQRQFSSLYYGGLGHDDLILFARSLIKKYPKIYEKINKKYSLIIIDEYQDTPECIISLFLDAVKSKSVDLFFYGDSMQQIYQKYSIEVREIIENITLKDSNITNYRSNKQIIDLLNNIYADANRLQKIPSTMRIANSDFNPKVIIVGTNYQNKAIENVQKSSSATLILYLFNRERFERIGASNLFNAYNSLPQYSFFSSVSALDVLLETDPHNNPDDLCSCLLTVYFAKKYFENNEYGRLIKLVQSQANIFTNFVAIHKQSDKRRLNQMLEQVFSLIDGPKITIGKTLEILNEQNMINKDFFHEITQDVSFSNILNTSYEEFTKLQINLVSVSTQHGVKGESHDSVLFVAEDSTRNQPFINMYKFFKLWSQNNINLSDFEKFIFEFENSLLETFAGSQYSSTNKDKLQDESKIIYKKFSKNSYFVELYESLFLQFQAKATKKLFSSLSSTNVALRTLSAYKLFYVGCSRARRNLTIIVNKDSIREYEGDLVKKFENVGFEVKYFDSI